MARSLSKIPTIKLISPNPSGLTEMITELLTENINSFPSRRFFARHTRVNLSLIAADYNRGVLLRFNKREIYVSDAQSTDLPQLSGDWLVLSEIASGLKSPIKALHKKEINLYPSTLGRINTLKILLAAFVLSVPKKFYKSAQSD